MSTNITSRSNRSIIPKIAILASVLAIYIEGDRTLQAYPLQDLTSYVQPLCGTDKGGNTFPGAVVPFGMMQWSPDTPQGVQGGLEQGGYFYPDRAIVGFSLGHLSGAGGDYAGDFAFTPLAEALTQSPATSSNNGNKSHPSPYSHSNETATPGYYSVQFDNGIKTELTATCRTGFGRFTYPAGATAGMMINAGSGASIIKASMEINAENKEVSGVTTGAGFLGSGQNHPVYFDVIFDHDFSSYGVWDEANLKPNESRVTGPKTGVYLNFDLTNGGTVLARVAISYISVANAQANLQAESPDLSFNSAGFDAMKQVARDSWNNYLNKIQVSGGSQSDMQTFYTALYHCLQAPSVVSDANGDYLGFDGHTHSAPDFTKYEFFSGWDIYRSECQLLAMLDPARASDMAQSLVLDAQQSGAMPRWTIPPGDTGTMLGDTSAPIIAGMYAFGARHFDTQSALAALIKGAVDPSTRAKNGVYQREDEADYLKLGYVPAHGRNDYGPVSETLEYCSDDFADAQFAKALGDTEDYSASMKRAQGWVNLFNKDSGYLQLRLPDGTWASGFALDGRAYPNNHAYVEGTASQYVWMVPFNLKSLTTMMGGPATASDRLDRFFTKLNDGSGSRYAYMGNEPCSETPFIYDFLGEPSKASEVVRRVETQLYSAAPGGLPGNDDLGQTSSWYVWAALGMYPEIPGDDTLVFCGPLFPQATIHLTTGDVTITAAGAQDDAPYIQSLTVNGQPYNAPWIRFAALAKGANLAFTMGGTPNTSWGTDTSAAPASYTNGMSGSSDPTP
jgi:predicted alpha-1,2-mannosidase